MSKRRKLFRATRERSGRKAFQQNRVIPEIVAQAITLTATNRLKLWDKNPKSYSKQDISRLAELYRRHGMSSPLVVWYYNMVVYKGNKSLLAARLIGLKQVPCILRAFPSEVAANAYGLSDNKAGEWGTWDEEALDNLMDSKSLSELGEATGFTERELSGIHDGWEYNPAKVENMAENEDSISHIVRLRVPQEYEEDLLEELNDMLGDYHATLI